MRYFEILPFSASETDDIILFIHHHILHKKGFIFCCSAGNTKFSEFAVEPKDEPVSFFTNCRLCVVVGAHSINELKEPCLPMTFGSAGCCISDEERPYNGKFKQGVTCWALGESIMLPKINQQKNDRIVSGTSASTAIISGIGTFILPKIVTLTERLKKDKSSYSSKFKAFLFTNSAKFTCARHNINRSLIFDVEKSLTLLGYEKKT